MSSSDFEFILGFNIDRFEKYRELYNFFVRHPEFNPNGKSDIYNDMWAINSLVDTSYKYYMEDEIIYKPEEWNILLQYQNFLIFYLIENHNARINNKRLYSLILERNAFGVSRGYSVDNSCELLSYLNEKILNARNDGNEEEENSKRRKTAV